MGLLDDVNLPEINLRIALRKNDSPSAKAPKLVGYVMLTVEQAEALLATAKASEERVTFLRVAMWGARAADAKYPLEGNVNLNSFNPEVEKTQPASETANPKSIWW